VPAIKVKWSNRQWNLDKPLPRDQ